MSTWLEAIGIIKALNEEMVVLENAGKRRWFWRFSCERRQIRAVSGILVEAATKFADRAMAEPTEPQ